MRWMCGLAVHFNGFLDARLLVPAAAPRAGHTSIGSPCLFPSPKYAPAQPGVCRLRIPAAGVFKSNLGAISVLVYLTFLDSAFQCCTGVTRPAFLTQYL